MAALVSGVCIDCSMHDARVRQGARCCDAGRAGEGVKLQRLAPRLATANTGRLATLQTTAGATPRIRGNSWMATRRRILLRDRYTCQGCGLVRSDHEIDHRVPLHMGGKNNDENLQVLCRSVGEHEGCHARKTRTEAGNRAGYCE